MDKQLDVMFERYGNGGDLDEEHYQEQARMIGEGFEKKMAAVGEKLRFAQDLLALYRYFMDARVAWQRKAVVVAAIVYFISPLDAIPDLAPFVGYLDDFGVIMAVTKYLSTELEPYYPG
jgi:uncharacterized membrane protein YkvA (DUF1232 family)